MLTCFPSSLQGTIKIPASKSVTQRALALALITPGVTRIMHAGKSNDEKAAWRIIEQLGAELKPENSDVCLITSPSQLNPLSSEINCGESALALRMFTPLVAMSHQAVVLTGEGTLLNRRHDFPLEVFRQLNIGIEQPNASLLPIKIQGPLKAESIRINAAKSSQYLTGLLFALAASCRKPILIEVEHLVSRPYLKLSVQLLQDFGYSISWMDENKLHLEPWQSEIHERTVDVEGDWSSAAFWMVGAALSGNVSLSGLNPASLQADRVLLDVFKSSHIPVSWNGQELQVSSPQTIHAFELHATDCPDLIPIASILASRAKGTSCITGINRLRNKESDREKHGLALLHLLGVEIETTENAWYITGSDRPFSGGVFSAQGDHRLVMAAAIASTCSKSTIHIEGAEAVAKSYPDFFKHFQELGGSINQ
jgi:3-phosphoshikimate 1-carboxyvinyltransferase